MHAAGQVAGDLRQIGSAAADDAANEGGQHTQMPTGVALRQGGQQLRQRTE